jgi:hypothetical protein
MRPSLIQSLRQIVDQILCRFNRRQPAPPSNALCNASACKHVGLPLRVKLRPTLRRSQGSRGKVVVGRIAGLKALSRHRSSPERGRATSPVASAKTKDPEKSL